MNKRGMLDLYISLLPRLMPAEKLNMLQVFECEDDLLLQTREDMEHFLGRKINNFWDINEVRAQAERIETVHKNRSINWVSWSNAAYPPLLREMYDPPAVIYYRGCLPDPDKSLLGMVGTRRPSPEAANQAYTLSYGAGRAGLSVVSGLALGIDAMSHRGNLAGGVPGYAVLGSGVDEIYPSSNRPVAKRILDSGGALLSEYPPGTPPSKWNFPARNRIIAALSRGVIIVEAPKKSGALITAAFALEQGKDLWVASSGLQERQYGSLHDKMGTINLAVDGAEVIYTVGDILEKWNIEFTDNMDTADRAVWDSTGMELSASMADFLEINI
ncbi:MAG: DNA-processing protein DprA [Treponema sp.]|jgi:DNA processing protein|nr:DNA-processing protein DprA [Treponema sp.]